MDKRFPGSARHIDRLRRQGLTVEAPLFFSGMSLIVGAAVLFLGCRRIVSSIGEVTTRCWGEPESRVVGCLGAVMVSGWLDWATLLSLGAVVSLLMACWVKRPRLQLDRLGIDGSRLSHVQWFGRLRRAPLSIGASLLGIAAGGVLFQWVARGDVIEGLLPQTVDSASQLILRAAMGAGGFVVASGVLSGAMGLWQFRQKTRMSDQEVRQEHKDDSGDPLVKGQQRSLHHAMLHEELVKAVKRSKVVFVASTKD